MSLVIILSSATACTSSLNEIPSDTTESSESLESSSTTESEPSSLAEDGQETELSSCVNTNCDCSDFTSHAEAERVLAAFPEFTTRSGWGWGTE
jgi:hypothetical protein